ncbi:hypothetical protein J7J08_09105 [Stenotrophomonas sp. ISL-67]|uniref:hypothetical protein n=1 Tax=Stenotrophomonas sp. ISL-67 TaxID=2819171 RepID=UPI001BE5C9D2|nr:hypothetical protein [Stenotrophomonas sp. ISL-67]MBT2767797.1 hypothetical protein [Stenotrophomonas sp. ISL-67]
MSPPSRPDPAGPPRPAEQVWTTFLSALEALPADVRLLLLLHDVAGAPIEELMPLLGLPAAECRQRLEAAHACLRAHARHLGAPPACP